MCRRQFLRRYLLGLSNDAWIETELIASYFPPSEFPRIDLRHFSEADEGRQVRTRGARIITFPSNPRGTVPIYAAR